jgi:tryptophanyl-tRNA synthetase
VTHRLPIRSTDFGTIDSSHIFFARKNNKPLQDQQPTMADPEPSITAALAADAPTTKQTVDPYNVSGEIGADGVAKAIDYLKLVDEFGTRKILEGDLARFETVTGHKPHRFMRRGIVFSHRDLNLILDRHERGEPFFLYTGRGPSSDSMHIGHTIPFEFTK